MAFGACFRKIVARCALLTSVGASSLRDVRRDALEAAFSPATKLLLLNSPHNPTGAGK